MNRFGRIFFGVGLACGAVACGDERDLEPSPEIFHPILEDLDRNVDGVVDAGEYERVRYAAASFGEVDGDGSGNLDAREVSGLVLSLDPTNFDGLDTTEPVLGDETDRSNNSADVQEIFYFFQFLVAEVEVRGGHAYLPERLAMREAALTERIDSPESQQVLTELYRAGDIVGLSFPERLRPSLVSPSGQPGSPGDSRSPGGPGRSQPGQ
ncbi:MAG: hypothetical protein QGG40_13755 [Myxococcota bacterium]|nr:hypothetical protein [Myxococcota bacterium]